MLAPTSIKDALNQTAPVEKIQVQGWVRTRRDAKDFSFIELNDGSSLGNLQIIARNSLPNYAAIQRLMTGASIIVGGALVASQGKGQQWELIADDVTIVGASDESYPLQKKGHTPEFLREIAHLRPRSNLFGCVFRVRSRLAFAIHQFFQERGFYYIHTPIITGSDCEGAGELFRVTGIDCTNPPRKPDGSIDYNRDFFGRSTYLTVSGQLEAEAFASALSKVYTFGPTFRAENSNTSRHANEFWMIEPEMAFTDLNGNMDLAEEIVKYLIRDVREKCPEELGLFAKFVDKELLSRLDFVVDRPFQRISYTEAIELLKKSTEKFEFPVEYRLKSAVGARALADREAFQMSGHSFQLSQGNQAVLHAVERRQKNRYCDGPAGSGNWRDCRGKPARGTAGGPGSEHATVQDGPEGLQVVSRSASLRDSAALRFWAWLRAHADVCDRRLKYS